MQAVERRKSLSPSSRRAWHETEQSLDQASAAATVAAGAMRAGGVLHCESYRLRGRKIARQF